MVRWWIPILLAVLAWSLAPGPAGRPEAAQRGAGTPPASADSASTTTFILPPVTVSATRTRQTGLRTPASVTVVDTTRIRETVMLTPVEVTRTVPGVDFASKGLNQHTFAARGDRSVNSTALLMLTDFRYAAVPSLGFNIPYLLALAPSDIERIEVVRGPGAALYGPDADKGVLHFITRSPFESPGTRVSAAGGERSALQMDLRHASAIGEHWGVKVSAQYFRGDDWPSVDSTEVANRDQAIAAGEDPDTLRIGKRDFNIERWAGEARVDWRSGAGTSATLTGGLAQAGNTIDLTATSGAVQVRDWQYGYLQARGKRGRLFTNLFYNTSDAGNTYFLRTGLPVVDESRLWEAQIQHGADLGTGNRHRLLYGIDLRTTEPRTGGTIHGRNETNDTVTELGAYLNTTSSLSGTVDLVAALRGDYHDRLGDVVLSPRVGVLFAPGETQSIRAVYNRAFNSPSSTELFIDLEQGGVAPFTVRLSGIPRDGFTFPRDCEGLLCMWSPTPFGFPVQLPADATKAWAGVVEYLRQENIDISDVPPPTGDDVGSVYAALDPESEAFIPVDPDAIGRIEPLKRTLTNSVELGYKGSVAKRLSLQVDLYYWHRKNPVGEYFVGTPNVFFDPEDLASYLANYRAPEEVDSVMALIGSQPVGTISPDEAGASTDLLVLSRQGGSYDNFGADLGAEIDLGRNVWGALTYSWVLDNRYSGVAVLGDVALGVPRNKGSVSLGYRDRRSGRTAVLRARVVESFPVANGVYRGEVASYAALDLDLSYRVSVRPELTVTLSSSNLLDNHHREFIGAPELGRMTLGRVEVAF